MGTANSKVITLDCDDINDNDLFKRIRDEKISIIHKKIKNSTFLNEYDLEFISMELKKNELIEIVFLFNKQNTYISTDRGVVSDFHSITLHERYS